MHPILSWHRFRPGPVRPDRPDRLFRPAGAAPYGHPNLEAGYQL